MKICKKYYVDAEDRAIIATSGVWLSTYLIGTMASDLINAGFSELMDTVQLDNFEVEELPLEADAVGTPYAVKLAGLGPETYKEMVECLREVAEYGDRELWCE